VPGKVHWFNHAGSTIRYELTYTKHPEVLSYLAKVWRDGQFLGEIHDSVMRRHALVERWTESTAELLAVASAERNIRSMVGPDR
jgi:hypothetical protein